jgi:hypothetical protein
MSRLSGRTVDSSERAEMHCESVERREAVMRRFGALFAVIVVALVTAAPDPSRAEVQATAGGHTARRSVVGVWDMQGTFEGGGGGPLLLGFHEDRTLTVTTFEAQNTGGHGAWKKVGARRYATRAKYYFHGADADGTVVVTTELVLTKDGKRLEGDFDYTQSRLDGTVVFEGSGTLTGTRITARSSGR